VRIEPFIAGNKWSRNKEDVGRVTLWGIGKPERRDHFIVPVAEATCNCEPTWVLAPAAADNALPQPLVESADGFIWRFDPTKKELIPLFPSITEGDRAPSSISAKTGKKPWVMGLFHSADQKELLTVDADGETQTELKIRHWDASTFDRIRTDDWKFEAGVRSVHWIAKPGLLLVYVDDRDKSETSVWDVSTQRKLFSTPQGLAFSPSGNLIAQASSSEVRLYSVPSFRLLRKVAPRHSYPRPFSASLAISDSGVIVCGSRGFEDEYQRAIRLFDPKLAATR
jgi:hypothetical protein